MGILQQTNQTMGKGNNQMKVSTGGNYLKPTDEVKGKTIKFLDEGRLEESTKFTYDDGTPKKNLIFERVSV